MDFDLSSAPPVLKRLETRWENLFVSDFTFFPTGSHFTCEPPVTETDIDWICHGTDSVAIEEELIRDGWKTSDNQEDDYSDCMSYRQENVNIIVVYQVQLYKDWVKATKVCKYLNLMDKQQRKMVHRFICGEEL